MTGWLAGWLTLTAEPIKALGPHRPVNDLARQGDVVVGQGAFEST